MLPSLLPNNIEEHTQSFSVVKVLKERRNVFPDYVRSAQFKNIAPSFKYFFRKGIIMPQTRVNKTSYDVWPCIHKVESFLTGEFSFVTSVISSCNYVLTLLIFSENEVSLSHNKTWTSKIQKYDISICKKSKEVYLPIILHPECD